MGKFGKAKNAVHDIRSSGAAPSFHEPARRHSLPQLAYQQKSRIKTTVSPYPAYPPCSFDYINAAKLTASLAALMGGHVR
jgi:hypothetical protein